MVYRTLSPKILSAIFLITFFILRGRFLLSYTWSNRGTIAINHNLPLYPSSPPSQAVFQANKWLQQAVFFAPENYFAGRMMGYLLSSVAPKEESIAIWQEIGLPFNELVAWGKTTEIHAQWDTAIIWYQRAASLSPQSSVPWYHMAQIYERQQAWELALDAYDKAIIRNEWGDLPVLAGDAYARIALIYFSRLQPPQFNNALAASEAAIEQDEFHAPWSASHVHYLRGRVLWQNGRLEEAYKEFETAVFFYHNHPAAYYWLGVAHYMVGHKTPEAIIALNSSLTLQPNNKWPYLFLGQIYRETNDPQQAQQAYQQALAIAPNDVTIQNRLAELKPKP